MWPGDRRKIALSVRSGPDAKRQTFGDGADFAVKSPRSRKLCAPCSWQPSRGSVGNMQNFLADLDARRNVRSRTGGSVMRLISQSVSLTGRKGTSRRIKGSMAACRRRWCARVSGIDSLINRSTHSSVPSKSALRASPAENTVTALLYVALIHGDACVSLRDPSRLCPRAMQHHRGNGP